MKKRFLKVSFFCLLMACMPATFTSCKDYDDDIAVLTQQTGSLQSQVNTLEEALNANKEAAAQAAQAAADAMSAAKAAQATADEALAAAKAAQATGDEALALAKSNEAAVAAAQADALNALAAAELAKQAAATAKAEAIDEVMEQVKGLMAEERALTEKELAEIAGKIKGIEDGLDKLSGDLKDVNDKLDDVESTLNVVADDLATFKQSVEIQMAAFDEFQKLIEPRVKDLETNYAALLETVQGLETSVAALQAADEAIKGDIADVKTSVQANATAIAEINTRIDEINTKLDALDKKIDDVKNQAFGYTDAEVAELKAELMGVIKEMDERLGGKISTLASNLANALNTLSTVFADRLTSITLMPDAYADGIPCIDFSTAIFKEMTGEGDNWKVGDAREIRVTPNSIPVSYRLSPKSVNPNTILPLENGGVAFVEKTASILTRGAEDDCILKVDDFKVENGVLTVTASKNGDAAINKTEDGKINIAALRVMQIPTALDDKTTIAGAEVYSEYARVTEGVFTPTLAEVANPENHLYNTVNKAVANTYFAELPYDETLNLDSVISVCKNFNGGHTIMSKQEIDSYKLSVEYALADFNATNAPQFGTWSKVEKKEVEVNENEKEEYTFVTPGFYNEEGTFDAFNKKASGKQQVYRATLKHDGKVVDVKFIKVSIIPSATEAKTINLPSHSTAISCNPYEDYSFTISWRDFYNVLNNENIRLLNGTEFYNVYEQSKLQVTYSIGNTDWTEDLEVDFISDLDSSNPHAWGFRFNSQIPFDLSVDDVTTLDIKVVCTPNTRYANQSYPVLTVTTSLIFDPLRESLSAMNNQIESYWLNDNTLRVLPNQYESIYAGSTCDYRFPIQQAFMTNKYPSVVHNDKLDCANWDVFFSKSQKVSGYKVEENKEYELQFGEETGLVIEWETENDYHPYFFEQCNKQNNSVFVTVFENPAGREVIDANEPVQVVFKSLYPNGQIVPVQTYNLHFVKPLNFEAVEFKGYFVDGAIEGEYGYAINTADQFIIEDFRGNDVKKEGDEMAVALYNYYGVKDYIWHVDEAVIGIYDGKVATKDQVSYVIEEGREKGMRRINKAYTMPLSAVTNADLSLKLEGKDLIYVNTGGLPTEKEYYLVVPVTVEHKWGKAETAVVIPVKPGTIKNKVRK